MDIQKIRLPVLVLTSVLLLITNVPGYVFAGGITGEEVDGDLLHKTKKPKPTLIVRTSTSTLTNTPSFTPTITETKAPTGALRTAVNPSATQTNPVSINNAEAVGEYQGTQVVLEETYERRDLPPCCFPPAAMVFSLVAVALVRSGKRNEFL